MDMHGSMALSYDTSEINREDTKNTVAGYVVLATGTYISDYARWNSCNNCVVRYILVYYGSRTHQRAFANRNSTDDGGIRSNRRCALYSGSFNRPVGFGLQTAIGSGSTRVAIVSEHHAMADEDFVIDDYTFTYERV